MYNLKKMTFYDHDLRNFPKIHMSNYMTSVQLVEGRPIQLVPMYWACGLDNLSILSLLCMPLFGRIAEVNTCVKQLGKFSIQRWENGLKFGGIVIILPSTFKLFPIASILETISI